MTPELLAMDVSRWALGLLLLVFGANGILHFLPVPKLPPRAEAFRRALSEVGYLLPLWKGAEFFGAVLLLANLWVPFALALLAPVVINIFCFHLFLARKGLPLATALLICEAALAWGHRYVWTGLF